MKRPDLLEYVNSLPKEVAEMFHFADRLVIETEDTLSDEFQIAAGIVAVFERQAKQNKGES